MEKMYTDTADVSDMIILDLQSSDFVSSAQRVNILGFENIIIWTRNNEN